MSSTNTLSTKTANVHVSYEPEFPPPHPGAGWTRFVCISDTHSRTFVIPPGDVLLHSGDLSSWGYVQQLNTTLEWLKSLEHPIKIIIAGNHDLCLDSGLPPGEQVAEEKAVLSAIRSKIRSREMKDAGIYYLEHESFEFASPSGGTWTVYGSPSAPVYALGAFQYHTVVEADELYKKIPSQTEILLSHTPPFFTLDKNKRGKFSGCDRLARRLDTLDACRLHVFGHIHEATGARIVDNKGEGRVAVNAALPLAACAIIVDLKKDI